MKCPRCRVSDLAEVQAQNALSRFDSGLYICSPCGEDEAVRDFFDGFRRMEPCEWPVRTRYTFQSLLSTSR
jgi:hypothetical protein